MEVVTYKRLKSQSTKNNINNMDDTICCTIINLDDIPSCCFTPTKMTIKLRFLETNQPTIQECCSCEKLLYWLTNLIAMKGLAKCLMTLISSPAPVTTGFGPALRADDRTRPEVMCLNRVASSTSGWLSIS